MAWILDLDGVIWLAERPIPGSADAVRRLRDAGERVLFLTNNSSLTVDAYVAKLSRCGIEADADDVCTSAQAAASLVEPGSVALVCAGAGVVEALHARGVTVVRSVEEVDARAGDRPSGGRAPDAVVVGFHMDFDYTRLDAAFQAVRRGAILIGTNDDATYPTPDGPIAGGGALVAAVAYASGVAPVYAGKPFEASSRLVRARLGLPADGPLGDSVTMVGDRASTDGLMARVLGARFALVLSGVTTSSALPVEPAPDIVAADLAALIG